MDDLASHSFPLLTDSLKGESDLDSITLDELKLESDQMSSLDPANMLFDFLHPEKRELQNLNPVPHKIKVSKQQTINELFWRKYLDYLKLCLHELKNLTPLSLI